MTDGRDQSGAENGPVPAPFVDVRGLTVEFGAGTASGSTRKRVRAVDDVSFSVGRGETLGLVGESGSGKSTVARALSRLNSPVAGSVRIDGAEILGVEGRELRALRRRTQLVFQDPYSSLNPAWTVESLVQEPLRRFGTSSRPARRARAAELLELVGLSERFAKRHPRDLSGGQRQRVGIARALAADPDLLICDEPVSALDVSVQAQVLNLLVKLRDQLGLTCVFIAHNLSVVRWICDDVAVMYGGRIVERGTAAEVFASPRHPYTRALISAAPTVDPERERERQPIILSGEAPSPLTDDEATGCHFRDRCWLYRQLGEPERCASERPDLTSDGGRASACHFPDTVMTTVP